MRLELLACICASMATISVHAESCGDPIHCMPPQFYDEFPADESVVTRLDRLQITAAADADLNALEFMVAGQAIKPEITRLRSGATELNIHLAPPITSSGNVVARVTAKNRVGDCWGMKPWIIRIRP